MLKPYQTIEDVLASPWARQPQAERMERTDRVLRSTKLENNIYHDLRAEDTAMDEIEDYLTGRISRLEELEEPRRSFNGKEGLVTYANWYGRIVSASRIAPEA